MSEIRKDPFTNKEVIIAVERGIRPSDFKGRDNHLGDIKAYDEACPFCSGNENLTPTETFRLQGNRGWLVRTFPNRFPILMAHSNVVEENTSLFQAIKGIGRHEVIVDHYRHDKSLFNMAKEEFKDMLTAYVNRYRVLSQDNRVSYISLFKNYLKGAGASLEHPHSQIISIPMIPLDISVELAQCNKFYEENSKTLHRAIIEKERENNKRVIFETDEFMMVAPFASRFNYEVEIIYKYSNSFNEMTDDTIYELSEVFYRLFQRYRTVLGPIPFNLMLHSHPKSCEKGRYHWHFHVTPRLSNQAGFELSTGVYVNSVAPEDVAQDLKVY